MGEANKSGFSGTDEGGISGTDIKARFELGRADKGGVDRADIEAGKKASARGIASIDNSADSGGKITD